MRCLYLNYFWLVTILRSLRQSRAALEAETAGGLLDGDLHAGQAPALDPLPVPVIAVLQRHRLLRVGTLSAAGAVLAEARPLHGGGSGGGDAVALALVHAHLVLAGPNQLLPLAVLLLHQVEGGGESLAGVLVLRQG